MGRKLPRPDLDTQAQFIIYAAVHGDEAAISRFGLTKRSLQRYRQEAREEGSDLSRTVAAYGKALAPPEERTEARATSFAGSLDEALTGLVAIFQEKAQNVNPANPEGLRAVGEQIGRFLDHRLGLEYIGRLFGPAAADDDGTGIRPEEP